MAREHLSQRGKWQSLGVARGEGAEDTFNAAMKIYLRDSGIRCLLKPDTLRGIYGLHKTGRPHGIVPEFQFFNPETKKSMFVEIKRQGRQGNAHERACKYFMPGILESARRIARQPDGVVPFWLIFANGLATTPRYRQEITHWFKGYEGNLLLWDDLRNPGMLIDHFEDHIMPLLI